LGNSDKPRDAAMGTGFVVLLHHSLFFSIDVSARPVAFLGMVLITSVRRLKYPRNATGVAETSIEKRLYSYKML